MRLKNYLIVAGFAAAALFGGSPAWAGQSDDPSAAPAPSECSADAAPASEESGAGTDPCEVSSEEALAAEEEFAEEEALALEEALAEEERQREREEAGAPEPMPADPNYTG